MEIKIGDVVRLKSGGPRMTVEDLSGEYASCVWFENSRALRGEFRLQLLEPAAAEGIGVMVI